MVKIAPLDEEKGDLVTAYGKARAKYGADSPAARKLREQMVEEFNRQAAQEAAKLQAKPSKKKK